MVYEIQIKAPFRGLPQRVRAAALEKLQSRFSSDLIIKLESDRQLREISISQIMPKHNIPI